MGNGSGKFAMDGSRGAITTSATLDYETDASYTLTVQADDGNGGTATVNISVTDVSEGPDGSRDDAATLDADAAVDDPQYYHDKSLDRVGGDAVDYYTFTTTARYVLGLGASGG